MSSQGLCTLWPCFPGPSFSRSQIPQLEVVLGMMGWRKAVLWREGVFVQRKSDRTNTVGAVCVHYIYWTCARSFYTHLMCPRKWVLLLCLLDR